MKKYILALWMASFCIISCFSQAFTFLADAPFGIKPIKDDMTRSAVRLFFFDYDQDGDLDLFLSGLDQIDDFDDTEWGDIHYFMEVQENIGSKYAPQFGPRQSLYEDFPFPQGYFFPSIGDLNGDQLPDFIVSAAVDYIGNRTLTYCKGTGLPGPSAFDVIRFDSMGIPNFLPESFFIPELIDLDEDGDLDLLMSGFDPAFGEEDGADVPVFYYAKNFGTNAEPDLHGWYDQPYGLLPSPLSEVSTSADVDNDGDVDVLGAPLGIPVDSTNYLLFHVNTPGSNGKPAFTGITNSPFGLPVLHGNQQFLFPELVDLDGDGDQDLFVFQGTSSASVLKYYVNELCIPTTTPVAQAICEGDSLVIGGESYAAAGDYAIHLTSSIGCDSIILLSLTLIQPTMISLEQTICEGESYQIGNESFSMAGNYMVLLTAANGCDSLVLLSLTVNENYNTPITASICEGETYQIGNDSFTASGQYEVVLSSVDGCDSTILLNLVVHENYITSLHETICEGESYPIGNDSFSFPGQYEVMLNSIEGCDSTVILDLTVSQVVNSVTANDIMLTADLPGATYQWIDCDSGQDIPGETNQSFVPTVTGNYAVDITDGFGCSATSSCILVMVTGLAEATLSNAISIYPNPAKGWITILNSNSAPITSISVVSLSGQVIKEMHLAGENKMDVSFLDPGVYLLKLTINGSEIIKKLIIV